MNTYSIINANDRQFYEHLIDNKGNHINSLHTWSILVWPASFIPYYMYWENTHCIWDIYDSLAMEFWVLFGVRAM